MTISASQWGSPTASRRALLIHGMTMSSQSWEGVAQLLVADGQVSYIMMWVVLTG